MLDFSTLQADGVLFEQLTRELLIRQGFEAHWTGVGPDGGRDLIATERCEGPMSHFARRWLVSCKHNAGSGKSVGVDDVVNIVDACRAVNADGFLLVCSTQPTAPLVRRLEEMESSQGLLTRFWDGIEIERRLNTPNTLPLVHRFLPNDASKMGWTVHNAQSPSLWAGNYKDYFLYLSSRDAHSFARLKDVETIIARIEEVPLPAPPSSDELDREYQRQELRPRAVHFDDKHEVFTVFVDYLIPRDAPEKAILGPEDLNRHFRDGDGLYRDESAMWYVTYWDVRPVRVSRISDHFNKDHRDYYSPYMRHYETGNTRARWTLGDQGIWHTPV